jgi:hypothetical protein
VVGEIAAAVAPFGAMGVQITSAWTKLFAGCQERSPANMEETAEYNKSFLLLALQLT